MGAGSAVLRLFSCFSLSSLPGHFSLLSFAFLSTPSYPEGTIIFFSMIKATTELWRVAFLTLK